jgi:hypothetical protein
MTNQVDLVGQTSMESTLYAVRYWPACLRTLPWGNERFDCFVVNFGRGMPTEEMNAIAREIADTQTDWVHTLGENAEYFHDAIDVMSVSLGRQAWVGDGAPMTSWHDDLHTIDKMAEFIASGGLGGNVDYAVAVVIGKENEYRIIVDAISQRLRLHGSSS